MNPTEAARDPAEKAHDIVIGILDFAGLHLCPNVNAETGTVLWCGCAPGRCVREEGL